MPFSTIELAESYQGISRPVAKEAVAHILRLTNLPDSTPILNVGASGTAYLENSTIEEDIDPVRFSQKEKLFIQVSENYTDQTELTMQSTRPEGPVLFYDEPRGIVIRPVYSPTTLTISVKFRANDQPSAEHWRNCIRRKIAEDLMAVSHEVQYQYLIPTQVVALLSDVYKLKETIDPDNEKLSEWFRRCWNPGATSVTKMNGSGSRLAITELQTDVIGFFDFTTPPQYDKHEEGSAWEISFDYIVRFDKPSSIQIAYPLLVHQQMLPEHWFNTQGAYRPWLRPKRSSASRRAFDAICNQTKPAASDNVGGMQYPTYDDWYPQIKQKDTNSILRVLCSIDPADRKYIERFNGFGIFDINPRFLAFMQKHYQYVFKKEESPFVLELWDGWDRIDPSQIETNADLDIRTKYDLPLRHIYHLRFSALVDLTLLSDAATLRFRTDGVVCREFLLALCPELESMGLLPSLTSTGMVQSDEYWTAVRYIGSTNPIYRSEFEVTRTNTSAFVLEAHRKE